MSPSEAGEMGVAAGDVKKRVRNDSISGFDLNSLKDAEEIQAAFDILNLEEVYFCLIF